MRWSPTVLAVALAASGSFLGGAGLQAGAGRQVERAAGDDLVAIDVRVLDATGHPAVGLTPDQFDLTLDGQSRRVVSARFVSADASEGPGRVPAPERLFVLAIDRSRFTALESIGMTIAAQGFVDRIPDADRVAVFTYPDGETLEPTTDREAVRRVLEKLAGLRPGHVEAGAGSPGAAAAPASPGPKPQASSPEPSEGGGAAGSPASDGLRGVLAQTRAMPGRKVVVLVTPATAPVGPVPDDRELISLGLEVMQGSAILYTLLVDPLFIDLTIPEKERPSRAAGPNEETVAFERWLGRLSAASGGGAIRVAGVSPRPIYDRLLTEVSGYYVLGVDGTGLHDDRPHNLSVSVKPPSLTVRARSWAIPSPLGVVQPSSRTLDGPGAGVAADADATAAPRAAADRPRSSVPSDPILNAFDRGQYAVAQQGLAQVTELARWIRDFRNGRSPWSDAPRRASVFALEVAAVAFGGNDAGARDEAVKLLTQQAGNAARSATPDAARGATQAPSPKPQASSLKPQGASAPDGFECGWYWAALMLFEGADHGAGETFASRAVSRCPNEPRIVLAKAVLTDLNSPVLVGAIRVGAAAEAEQAAHQAVLDAYQAAMKFPETEVEARVRQAWLLYRLKRFDEALKLMEAVPAGSTAVSDTYQGQLDQQVRYLGRLVEGHVLRATGRLDEAAASYRKAIEHWPSAQAARIALMTLAGTRGQAAGAALLASEVESAPEDALDPWWWFWQGDHQLYPALIARLRQAVQ